MKRRKVPIFPALLAFIPQLIATVGTAASSIGTGVGSLIGSGLGAAGLGTTGTSIGTGIGTALGAPGGLLGGVGSALGGGGGLFAPGGLLTSSVGGGLPGSASLPEVLASPSAEMMGLNQGVVFSEGAQVAPGMAPVPATVGSEVGGLPTAVLGGAPQAAGVDYGQLTKLLGQAQGQMQPKEQQQPQPVMASQPQPRPTAPQPSQPPVGMEQLLLRLLMQRSGQAPGQGIASAL